MRQKPPTRHIQRAVERMTELGLTQDEIVKIFALHPPESIFNLLGFYKYTQMQKKIGVDEFLRKLKYLNEPGFVRLQGSYY